MIHVVIVEDSIEAREGLKYLLLLEKEIKVLKTYKNAEELLLDTDTLQKTDIILMDIELPGINGIKATRLVKDLYPQINVLILTIFEDQEKIMKAIQAGATGYILKNTAPGELVGQLKSLNKGGSPISPGIARKLLEELRKKRVNVKSPEDYKLTSRELEVFRSIVEGYTYKEIGDELNMASSTAKKHILHIYKKLNVSSKVEFIKKVIEENLLDEL